MRDSINREINYMRISITDRCNLRCQYCMPDGIVPVPMEQILTYEEICSVAAVAARLGIRYIKVTGGEPLVRRDCPELVGMLKAIPGIEKVTITTNGVLLGEQLDALAEAGIDGINVSLDTLDRERFARITGFDVLNKVLEGVFLAVRKGIRVKLNVVSLDVTRTGDVSGDAQKMGGDSERMIPRDWLDLIELTRENPVDVRFIELMPIGYGKSFPAVSHDRLLAALGSLYPGLAREESVHGPGPAVYYHIPGYAGSIGLISAIHGKFCSSCNRVRLTAKGYLKPCLCYEDGLDLRPILRSEETEAVRQSKLESGVQSVIWAKPGEHCFERPENITEHNGMVSIGG